MNTIEEKLQIIADSTSAIKNAIIEKGGEISGNLTTYADSINNLVTEEEAFVFNVTLTHGDQGNKNFTGTIDFGGKWPGPGAFYFAIDTDNCRSAYFTTEDKLVEFKNVYLYYSNVDYAIYVPVSTNTYSDPGGPAGADINVDPNKQVYKVKVVLDNQL